MLEKNKFYPRIQKYILEKIKVFGDMIEVELLSKKNYLKLYKKKMISTPCKMSSFPFKSFSVVPEHLVLFNLPLLNVYIFIWSICNDNFKKKQIIFCIWIQNCIGLVYLCLIIQFLPKANFIQSQVDQIFTFNSKALENSKDFL